MAEQLGQVWLRWTIRPQNQATQSEASANGGRGESIETVSGEVLRSECEAFCREAARPRANPTQLHMGQDGATECCSGSKQRLRHPRSLCFYIVKVAKHGLGFAQAIAGQAGSRAAGAVYDRASFLTINEIRDVIDRAYCRSTWTRDSGVVVLFVPRSSSLLTVVNVF